MALDCDSLLAEAARLFAEHRNAESIVRLALALESALANALSSMLVQVPGGQRRLEDPEIQMLHKRYMKTIGSMPLGSLRNVMINVLTRELRAQTIPEALQIIEQSKRFANAVPPAEQLAAIKDPGTRSLVETLRDVPIIALRSAVMHQTEVPADGEVMEQQQAVAKLVRQLGAPGRGWSRSSRD